MYVEQMELCLDCRCQAAEQVLQQCQGHKASIVVYNDAKSRELVQVHWPGNAFMPPKFTVNEKHLITCGHDRKECSSPHHYLEGRILNLWRENTVVTSTRPSPVRIVLNPDSCSLYSKVYRLLIISSVPSFMQTWFLAELKRATTIYKRVSVFGGHACTVNCHIPVWPILQVNPSWPFGHLS